MYINAEGCPHGTSELCSSRVLLAAVRAKSRRLVPGNKSPRVRRSATRERMLLRRARLPRSGLRGCRCASAVPQIGQMLTVRQVVDAHAQQSHRYTPPLLSASWNALGKLAHQPAERRALRAQPKLLEPLASATERALADFDERPLAATADSLASLHAAGWRAGDAGDALWEGLAERGARLADGMRPAHLCRLARAYAIVGRPAGLDALAHAAAPRLYTFAPRELSQLAWACGKARHAAPLLLDGIAREVVHRAPPPGSEREVSEFNAFNSQDVANMAWAYAKLGHAAPALLDALAAQAVARGRWHTFQPQHLAITAWAYAKLGHAAPALLDAIGKASAPRLREFSQQELCNTAWAYAKLGHASPALFAAIAKTAPARLAGCTPQGLAQLVWAYGSMVKVRPPLSPPSSAPAPPQGAPGGSGRLDTLSGRGRPTGRPATASGARALAAFKAGESTTASVAPPSHAKIDRVRVRVRG